MCEIIGVISLLVVIVLNSVMNKLKPEKQNLNIREDKTQPPKTADEKTQTIHLINRRTP